MQKPPPVILDCNPAALEIFGYSKKEIVGRTTEFLHVDKEHLKKFQNELYSAIKKNGFLHMDEFRMKRVDGTIFPSEHTVVPLNDDGGNCIGWTSVVKDITEKKRAERALKESERRFREIFENEPEYCYIISPKGTILDLNNSALKTLGYRKEEIIGKPLKTIYAPESHSKMEKIFEKWKRTGELRDEEMTIITRNGERRIVLLSATSVRDNGKILHSISVQRDITKRKEAEMMLKENEERLKTILDHIHTGVVVIDPRNCKIVDVNPKATDIIGIRKEEIIGKVCNKLICPAGDFKCPLKDLNQKIENSESLLINSKGEKIPIIKTVVPVNIRGQQFLVESFVDISEQKRMEKVQVEFNEVLRLINKILRHDILNDLTVVSNSIDLYIETKDRKLLNTAFKSIEKSINLIKNMKELESLFSTHGSLRPYSIREAVNEVIQNYPVDFEIDGNCSVVADEALNSVIDNILRNAVKHGNADRIDVKIENKGKYCEIRIADNGTGIPDEIKDKIFDEGFSYGEYKGSGLGLYIVKKTVERYQGNLYIEDNHPKGAIFILTLICSESQRYCEK